MEYLKTLSRLLVIRRRQQPTRFAGFRDDRRAGLENGGHLDKVGLLSPKTTNSVIHDYVDKENSTLEMLPGSSKSILSKEMTLTSATEVQEALGKSLGWIRLQPETEPN